MSPKGTGSAKLPVMIAVGIVGVLFTILALQGLVGTEWTAVAQAVSSTVVIIGIIGFVVAVIVSKK